MKSNQTEEEKIYDFWIKNQYFNADPNGAKKHFSLLVPPPNLTGELHLGHAMQHSILDACARYRRLKGFDVLLLPGVDHAGIQFEATFEKKLARENLSKYKLGREKWLELAWKFKEEIYKSVSTSWRMMGLSADWQREVFTLDEGPKQAVFEFFNKLWRDNLIYKGPYIVQWCPKDNTAIEDVEMEYEERKEKLYYLKYGPLTLATARPETKFGDTAMAVNPNDKRYKEFEGREFEIDTLAGKKKLKVIADEAVDPKFGTGVIKVTPGHDLTDYEIGKRHNLPILQVINKEGKLTDLAGKYSGMKVMEARIVIIGELKKKGILIKEEEYVHNVAVCERCKTVVEPLISEEWFVKMDDMAKSAIRAIKGNKIAFLPKNYSKVIVEWLDNIHDWCISRSLWWGHRIPVWYKDSEQIVSLESPGSGWIQDEQVLDTWFSSGLWPLSTLGFPKESNELKAYFPWDFEISAPEIKFLWIARMIMISVYLKGQIPFKTMFFHGMLRDLEGRKFSKSLGNGIDPQYLIDSWGVDATRMALYTYSIPGRDGRVSKQSLDERGKNFRNFGTKLRNIARFIYELKPQINSERKTDLAQDQQIKKRLVEVEGRVSKHMENLELHLAVELIYEFVWHEFADVYIEKSKNRRDVAQNTLENVFYDLLIMLHPFMPFLTEELYQKYIKNKASIVLESWPYGA